MYGIYVSDGKTDLHVQLKIASFLNQKDEVEGMKAVIDPTKSKFAGLQQKQCYDTSYI